MTSQGVYTASEGRDSQQQCMEVMEAEMCRSLLQEMLTASEVQEYPGSMGLQIPR